MTSPALEFLRRLARPDLTPLGDGELLARSADGADAEGAFAELVRRHGPMVAGVCRRILGNAADAEDAFQAAFVVLDRRRAALVGRSTVGDFLHGVAVRTALKARTQRHRRRRHELAAAKPPTVPAVEVDDLAELVDAAVRALPAKLRGAVVLCDLQGVSRADAAARLGVPEGTVSSRLGAAHAKLAKRLARAVAVVLASLAPREVSGVAVLVPKFGAVPAGVSVLATEVLRAMVITKLKLAVAGGLLAAGLIGSGAAVTRLASAQGPAEGAKAEEKPKAAAAPAKPPGGAGLPPWFLPPAGEPTSNTIIPVQVGGYYAITMPPERLRIFEADYNTVYKVLGVRGSWALLQLWNYRDGKLTGKFRIVWVNLGAAGVDVIVPCDEPEEAKAPAPAEPKKP